MGFDSEVGCGCVAQYHVADFREADQKRLNNVYRLAYLPLVLIVFSFDNAPIGIKLSRFEIGLNSSLLRRRSLQPLDDTRVVIVALQISRNTAGEIIVAASNKGIRDSIGQ